jgi:hypothetical protein
MLSSLRGIGVRAHLMEPTQDRLSIMPAARVNYVPERYLLSPRRVSHATVGPIFTRSESIIVSENGKDSRQLLCCANDRAGLR